MARVVERVKSASDPEGQVVIGVGQSIGPVLMGPLLEEAAQRLPRVRLQVRELMGGLLPELMRSGTIDVAISLNTVTGHGIRSVAILSEEMCLVGQRRLVERHLGGATMDKFRFRDLDRLPLYLSRRGQFVRDTIEAAAKSKGIALNLRSEVDSVHILKELALSGTGCCVLSRSSVRRESDDHDLYIGQITAPIIRRDVFLVYRRAMPRAASAVVDLSLEVLARLVKDGLWSGTLKAQAADIRKAL
jgi:DNA-binding transcriptional LysR family regulator